MRGFAIASTSASPARAVRSRRHAVCTARRPVTGRVSAFARASSDDAADSPSPASSGRGGGTPGSWNLGVAHSDAKSTDQRSFVDRLFKAYPTLVAAAKDGDVWKLQRVMDDAYAPAPDATTKKIRDAQIRAAALEAISSGKHETLLALLDRGADLGLGKNDDDDAGGEWARAAAAEGHAGVLDALIEKCGVSVRGRDAQTGRTPLLCAAANGREACIARIVSRLREEVEEEEDEEEDGGSDVFNHLNATDFDGNTAAMLAAENDRAGCLNQLRGCGCDLDIARASDGATAMEIHRARVRVRLEKAFKKVPSDHNARRG